MKFYVVDNCRGHYVIRKFEGWKVKYAEIIDGPFTCPNQAARSLAFWRQAVCNSYVNRVDVSCWGTKQTNWARKA